MYILFDKAVDKFPELKNHQNCWPVTDIIMMRLKYTSSRAQRQEMMMAAGSEQKAEVISKYFYLVQNCRLIISPEVVYLTLFYLHSVM